jgi:hypothetical protein
MTDITTNMIPDGLASAPGLALSSEPTTGLYKKAAGKLGVAVGGVEVGELNANGLAGGVKHAEVLFTEDGAGTYTGTISLPAGSRIIDIGVDGIALWNSAGAVTMIVGDTDDNGFFTSTDLKATDLLAGEINNIEHPGGKAGVYIASEQRVLYSASARDIIGVVTVASGSGTAGRTRLYVVYAVVDAAAAVKS